MRKDLFTHLQIMDFRFFDDNKVGHLMSRLVNDLRDITNSPPRARRLTNRYPDVYWLLHIFDSH